MLECRELVLIVCFAVDDERVGIDKGTDYSGVQVPFTSLITLHAQLCQHSLQRYMSS